MTNPNCGICGHLNQRGFCNLTACIMPNIKTDSIRKIKQTNADRIRAMTDEELSRWLGDMIYPECVCCPAAKNWWCEDCYETWQVWLKQEAE